MKRVLLLVSNLFGHEFVYVDLKLVANIDN